MRALRKTAYGVGFVEVLDVEIPQIKNSDDVLLEVAACGVCGTDLHIYDDEFPYYPPVTLGHEFSAFVKEVGEGVENVKVGDFVVAEPHSLACMKCDLCRQGYWQICEHKRSPGWGIDGGFTDYVIMPSYLLHKMDKKVPIQVAALAEPVAIVTNYVSERCGIKAGDFVVVVGAGPIGILAGMVAKECGAKKVVMLGVESDEAKRFPIAKELGIDDTINVIKCNPIESIKEMNGGKLADVVIEASGNEKGIQSGIHAVRKCGKLCVIGLTGKETVSVPWDVAQKKMIDVFFNMSSSYTSWDRAVSIIENSKYDLSKLVTNMENINNWKNAFDDLKSGKAIKVMFVPEKILDKINEDIK